jgi:hypothetical protein
MSVIEMQWADKATRNAGDSVTKRQKEQLLFVTLDFKP